MKKNKITILISIILVIRGSLWRKIKISIYKKRIEEYILFYNYKDITSVTFKKIEKAPMGTPTIKGYVSNDKNMRFSAYRHTWHFNNDLDFENKKTEYLFKNEITKSVEEIEKEERGELNSTALSST